MKRVVAASVVAAAAVSLATPAHAGIEGVGFTEQILSCTGGSNVTLHPKRGMIVLIRVAPECDPKDPIMFRASKKRVIKVTATRDARSFKHTVIVIP